MNKKVSILVLAAGGSKRMKKTKQLLPWGKDSLIEHVLSNAISSVANQTYVLLGAEIDAIRTRIEDLPVHIVENKEWESGIGNSIAVGVQAILKQESPEAILIMLCDQPKIDTTYINLLIEQLIENIDELKIVGTQYGSRIGVPAIFSPDLFADLTTLKSDKGAAQLIADNSQYAMSIEPMGKEKDLDTWQDYIGFRPE